MLTFEFLIAEVLDYVCQQFTKQKHQLWLIINGLPLKLLRQIMFILKICAVFGESSWKKEAAKFDKWYFKQSAE